MVFHTMPEYEEWKESLGAGGTKGWDVKYYKGLGTSTNDEAREYFANITNNRKEFVWTGARWLPPGDIGQCRRANPCIVEYAYEALTLGLPQAIRCTRSASYGLP